MDWFQYVFLAIVVLFLINRFRPVKGLKDINKETLLRKIKDKENIKIVDVREPSEFSSNHIKGAINIPLGRLSYVTGQDLNKDDHIVLVCLSGNRSKQGARKLAKKGYPHLYNLLGGMMSWKG